MTRRWIAALMLCAMPLMADAVKAATVRFTLSGDYVATWELDASASPSFYQSGTGAVFWNIAGQFEGAARPLADITFYSSSVGGGLNLYDFQGDLNLLAADGPQLYVGPESAPNFKLGTFALSQFRGPGVYTLTVAEVSAVPEPSSVALVALGILGLMIFRCRSRPTPR